MRGQIAISAIIPAYNEKESIAEVITEAQKFVDEVIVVDDGSTDGTGVIARGLGAWVVTNEHRKGYAGAIKTGFEKARGDILVTLDADGENHPGDIPRLLKPILEGKADLVLGRRGRIPRPSERFINWLTNFKLKLADSGTGFRALKRELALKLDLKGKCTCGIFVLEANYYGARITEEPIALQPILKRRKRAWSHFWQIFYVLWWLVKLPTTVEGLKTEELDS